MRIPKTGINVRGNLYSALLNAAASATVTSTGAIAYVGPSAIGNIWYPTQVSISASNITAGTNMNAALYVAPNLPLAQMKTLLNTTQVTQLGNSQAGGGDSIGLINVTIPWGQCLLVQWTVPAGGTAPSNSVAVMSVTGTQNATYFT